MAEETAGFCQRMADFLDLDRRRILLNWASRAGALPAFRQRPDLDLAAVIDDMPTIFDHLLAVLKAEGTEPFNPDLGPAEAHATAHVRLRATRGFHASDVAQEYQQLRQTIWTEIRAHVANLQPSVADVLDVEHRLNYALDDIVIVTLETFDNLDASP